ncbi:MAG: AAA family ATPase [Acidobacteriota bacterium]
MTQTQKQELNVVEPLDGEDLRRRFAEEVAESGLSQAKIAREVGTNPSYVNQYLKDGTCAGAREEFEAKVLRWVRTRESQRALDRILPGEDVFFPTPTSRRVLAALAYAQAGRSMAVVYGGAGLGKSTAARHYATAASSVFLATVSPTSRKPGGLLKVLCRTLGLKASIWPTDMERSVVERLAGTRGLLIVDEAQHLTVESLETLRAIHDAAGIGLALLGNERVYTQMVGTRTAEFAQLFSRLGHRVKLVNQTAGPDAEALLDAWVAPVDAPARTRLLGIAAKDGGLRQLMQTLKMATIAAGGERVTASHVSGAFADLGGDE